MAAAEIAHALGEARLVGKEWHCRCPLADEHNNGDRNPSLTLCDLDGGTVGAYCHSRHAGEQERVIQALKDRGLWPSVERNGYRASSRQIVATYPYRDEADNVLFEVVRYAPKDFRQRRPNGQDDWKWNLKGVRRVLYRLPELLARPGETVYVVEGEKDADALHKLGLLATTNAGGAGKWTDDYSATLTGREVVILPDNDTVGREHAETVARLSLPLAKSVKIVELPELPEKGDVSDWLAQSHTRDELVALVAQATPFASPSNETAVRFQTVDEFLARRQERQARKAFWSGTLREGEVSLLVGRAMAGKSTIACALTRSLHCGIPLLGRQCLKARVAYLALERNGAKVAELFRKWNLGDVTFTDDLPPCDGPTLARLLEAEIERTKVEIIIVDHLQNLLRLQDANDYAAVSLALDPFVRLAKKTGCHLMLLHHQGKTRREDGIDVMGSEGFRASADVLLEATKSGDGYYLRAHVRDGKDLESIRLSVNFATGEVTGIDAKQAEIQDAAARIRNYLRSEDGAHTEGEIRGAVQLGKNVVNAALQAEIAGVIKTGTGKKGDPFRYLYSSADEQFMAPGQWNGLAGTAQMEEGTL